eukprot:365001-Chlamydomonas_euryale.AAC.5
MPVARRSPPPSTLDVCLRPRRSTLATVPDARRWPPSPTLNAGHHARRSTLATALNARRWPPCPSLAATLQCPRPLAGSLGHVARCPMGARKPVGGRCDGGGAAGSTRGLHAAVLRPQPRRRRCGAGGNAAAARPAAHAGRQGDAEGGRARASGGSGFGAVIASARFRRVRRAG